MIKGNLENIQNRIANICNELGRNPQEVTLVGVTKYTTNELIKEALDAGLEHIGENRLQDAQAKFPDIFSQGRHAVKHMIGHLQTNKVKKAVELFDIIESVDSLKLAQEVEKQAANHGKTVDILIQVNTAKEQQKFGIDPTEVEELFKHIEQFKHTYVNGLMAIAPLTDDQEVVRDCFRQLRLISEKLKLKYNNHPFIQLKELSMGMSSDFEIALEEGSTMVRVGSAIFKNE